MDKKINIITSTDIPIIHLFNREEYEIGIGKWENGEEFYTFRRKEKELNGKSNIEVKIIK